MIPLDKDKLIKKGTYDNNDGYWVKEYGDNKTFFSKYDEGYRAIEKLYRYENNILDRRTNNMLNKYSDLVDQKIKKELTLKDEIIFNNKYEGEPKTGTVRVKKIWTINIGDYDREKGAEITGSSSEWINMLLDKDKVVNEVLDGYEASDVPDGLVADRLDSVGYELAKIIDDDGIKELIEHGTLLEDTTALTKQTIYNKFVDVRKQLNENSVDANKRYAIVSPEIYAYIIKIDEFIEPNFLRDEIIKTGAVGEIAGFTLYKNNNLGEDVEIIFGHPSYATRVVEWRVPIHMQNIDSSSKSISSCAVQGRKIYTHKVTEPKGILIKKKNK